jgi:hypothetical protein
VCASARALGSTELVTGEKVIATTFCRPPALARKCRMKDPTPSQPPIVSWREIWPDLTRMPLVRNLRARGGEICSQLPRRTALGLSVFAGAVAVLAAAIGLSALMPGGEADAARAHAPSSQAAEQSTSGVGNGCLEQTWPYFSGSCLREESPRQVRVLPSTTTTNAVIVHGPATKKKQGEASMASSNQNVERKRERGTAEARQQRQTDSGQRRSRHDYTTHTYWRRGW